MSANPSRDPKRRVHHEYGGSRKHGDRGRNRNNAARRNDVAERIDSMLDPE